jgi:hypothetical protein
MNDIRLEVGMADNLKVKALVRIAGEGAFRCLIRLWLWARDASPTGDVSKFSPEEIEDVSGWAGEPGAFFAALTVPYAVGKSAWIDPDGRLHDWEQHQSWACGHETRRQGARKAANAKWARLNANPVKPGNEPESCGTDAGRMRGASNPQCGTDAGRNAPLLSSPILSSPNQDQDQNQKIGASAPRKFVKPTVEEVQAYCQLKGYTFDPVYFWNFYESKGWMVGKSPMKNWHGACATFQANQKNYGPKETTSRARIGDHGDDFNPATSEANQRKIAELMARGKKDG